MKKTAISLPVATDTRPLYRKVESYIESLIHDGGLKPGDPIPSLSQLAKLLEVNNLTVRRAIRELVFRRVLVALQGRGTFVAEGGVKKILWVTGLDIYGGDASSYYGDLFHLASQECAKHGILLEPVWLLKDQPFETVLNANGGQTAIIGYIFSGCALDHRLLLHVKETRQPFVNLSENYSGKPRCVVPNFSQAHKLALDYLRSQKLRKVTVFYLAGSPLETDGSDNSLELDIVAWTPRYPRQSAVDRYSFQKAQAMLASGQMNPGIYIADDIMARGVTRAIIGLEPRARKKFTIIVQSSLQEIIPFGLPVSYVVFDIAEQARKAVEILLPQIHGRETELQHYCNFRLLTEEELPATMHLQESILEQAAEV